MAQALRFDRDQIPGVIVCVLAVAAFVTTVCWARSTALTRPDEAAQAIFSTYSIGILTCALLLWTYLEWRLHTIRRTLDHVANISSDVADLAQALQQGASSEQQQAVSGVASRLSQHADALKRQIELIHRSVPTGVSLVVIIGALIVIVWVVVAQL